MPKYIRKVQEVYAVQLTRKAFNQAQVNKSIEGLQLSIDDQILSGVTHKAHIGFVIETSNGEVLVHPGDYIVQASDDSLYAIPAEKFSKSYTPVLENTKSSNSEDVKDEDIKETETPPEKPASKKYC